MADGKTTSKMITGMEPRRKIPVTKQQREAVVSGPSKGVMHHLNTDNLITDDESLQDALDQRHRDALGGNTGVE
jgi:hypothetical protein